MRRITRYNNPSGIYQEEFQGYQSEMDALGHAGIGIKVPYIAIGCPVRNRAWVLDDYLAALDAIDYSHKEYLFLLNDSFDTSGDKLKTFMQTHSGLLCERFDEGGPGYRREEYDANHYGHLAAIRNAFIDLFLVETECDYLLSVDSDIIVPTDIIAKLIPLMQEQTMAAAAISNIPNKQLDGHTPGNFMIAIQGCIEHPFKYPLTGDMEVDVIGAVYLIPRRALTDGIRYGPHPQGEDVPFCLAARKKGYHLLVNLDVRCEHRMVEVKLSK